MTSTCARRARWGTAPTAQERTVSAGASRRRGGCTSTATTFCRHEGVTELPIVPVPGAVPSAPKFKVPSIGEVRKALAALVAFGGEALSLGLLHGEARTWTVAAIGFAGFIAAYRIPNDKASA